ncbi:MAG: hypothetical protein CSA81_10530 [Acidobacteria bacterium]|nr:MAG: hypothetical protein CSA81_10530 [Acidobacteriota bacterium]
MNLNRYLGIAAVILFVLSFMAFKQAQDSSDRFERGQKFLSNLNPDNISEILIDKGKDHVELKREDDHFSMASKAGYPARNQAVNRIITSILDMELEDEIGSGAELSKELEVLEGPAETTHIIFKNDAGKEMVNFFIGKKAEGGQGSYVKKNGDDETIYLTSKTSYLNVTPSSMIKDNILNIPQSDVLKIEGNGYTIEDDGGTLQLQKLPKGMETKASEFGQVKGLLSNLKIKDAFLADNPKVKDVRFTNTVTVYLKNKAHYQIAVGKKGETIYMKVQSGHQLKQIQLTGQESEEELKEKSKVLQLNDELKKFNEFHGSWVYELSGQNGAKFFFTKQDLIQKAK